MGRYYTRWDEKLAHFTNLRIDPAVRGNDYPSFGPSTLPSMQSRMQNPTQHFRLYRIAPNFCGPKIREKVHNHAIVNFRD